MIVLYRDRRYEAREPEFCSKECQIDLTCHFKKICFVLECADTFISIAGLD